MLHYKKEHSLWQSSFFVKYVVAFLVVLLIAVIIIISIFMFYHAKQKQVTLSQIDSAVRNTTDRIENAVYTYKNMSIFAILRESGGFDTNYLRYLKSSNESERDRFEYYTNFVSLASTMHILNKNIYAVYSFNQSGVPLTWTSNGGYNFQLPDLSLWRSDADDARGAPLLLEPYRAEEQDADSFAVARAIVDINSTEIIGYFAIAVRIDELLEACVQMQMYPDQNTYIINERNKVIGGVRNRESDPLLEKAVRENTFVGAATAAVDGETSHIFAYSKIPATDWTLLTSIPTDSIWRELNGFMFLSLFFTLLLLTLLFMIVFFIFFVSLTRPIDNLIALIINSGFFPELQTSSDEIKFLSSSFTMFSDIVQNIKIEHYIQQKRLKLEFLQLQINPHFLYGTLETVRMTAEIENNLMISDMVTLLSQILRYSIATENILATVRGELEILNNYIRLQQIRQDHTISVRFDIDPDCYEAAIPKLTLQPLVENSITHGLSDKNQINIFIQGRCTDEKVELSVSDDGKGMSGEALEQLRQSLLLEKKSSSHIGLWNVNRRIKLVYEDAYGIRVESAVKAGTTVRITLPKNGKGQKEL